MCAAGTLLQWLRAAVSFAVHSYLWMGVLLLIALHAGSHAVLYVVLSELFLHGFLLHPWAGYFLGVHWSDATGSSAAGACQPTMSTYNALAALLSLNLTYHVEHHDFPSVPWSRLPAVRALAPEYYDTLTSSPGLCTTIARWLRHGERVTYACGTHVLFD